MAGQQQDSTTGSRAQARPGDPLDLQESVAGEEDPGASFDVPSGSEGRSDPPAGQASAQPGGGPRTLRPGEPIDKPSTGKVDAGNGGA